MGAEENVYVEQLVSRHSIEELIVLMNKRDESKNMLYANTNELEDFESKYYSNKAMSTEDSGESNRVNVQANKVRYLLSNVLLNKLIIDFMS